jgi:hypothetical protein
MSPNEIRVIAIDWSGRAKGAAEHTWTAEVIGGTLAQLTNGREPAEVISGLIESARRQPKTVIGLDFAFSAPVWWLQERGFRHVAELWKQAPALHAAQLHQPAAPFWGHRGTKRNLPREQRLRETERLLQAKGLQPKSVFQLGGAGAVGTGSLRGMPYLLRLREAGFSIWPFGPAAWPKVVEIYPRLLTGPVDKGRFWARHAALQKRFPTQDPTLLERAAGSEDAFDAAFSALVMAEHSAGLAALEPRHDEPWRLEGAIWGP